MTWYTLLRFIPTMRFCDLYGPCCFPTGYTSHLDNISIWEIIDGSDAASSLFCSSWTRWQLHPHLPNRLLHSPCLFLWHFAEAFFTSRNNSLKVKLLLTFAKRITNPTRGIRTKMRTDWDLPSLNHFIIDSLGKQLYCPLESYCFISFYGFSKDPNFLTNP